MALETTADLDAFFSVSEHGVAATYTVQGGSTVTIDGILEKEYYETLEGGFVGLESSKPIFICKTSDVPSATNGDALTIDSVAYLVRGVQPDNTDVTTLILEQQ